jgi:hypothetical protein
MTKRPGLAAVGLGLRGSGIWGHRPVAGALRRRRWSCLDHGALSNTSKPSPNGHCLVTHRRAPLDADAVHTAIRAAPGVELARLPGAFAKTLTGILPADSGAATPRGRRRARYTTGFTAACRVGAARGATAAPVITARSVSIRSAELAQFRAALLLFLLLLFLRLGLDPDQSKERGRKSSRRQTDATAGPGIESRAAHEHPLLRWRIRRRALPRSVD